MRRSGSRPQAKRCFPARAPASRRPPSTPGCSAPPARSLGDPPCGDAVTSDARGAREAAYQALAGTEPVMARLAGAYGHPDPFEWFDGGGTGAGKFAGVLLHITGQRISAAAAFTIYDRITAASGAVPDASSVLTLGRARLRALGLPDAKTRCLLELAGRQEAGLIELESMSAHTDDDVTSALVAVPGIGLWSAQAFLLRQLHRPDVLPATDTGIRRAIGRGRALPRPPT